MRVVKRMKKYFRTVLDKDLGSKRGGEGGRVGGSML